MILRELSAEEIKSLSRRYKVSQKVVEDFLRGIGGISIETAYKSLNDERKLHKWNVQIIKAVSDGILLVTTKC